MGREKARLKLGRRTLLGHVRANAAGLGVPIRVIRKDLVRRCGPLGGIFTALKTTRKPSVLFLACDMPFVSLTLIRKLVTAFDGKRSVFTVADGLAGFPFILPQAELPTVRRRVETKQQSLQGLAAALLARRVPVSRQAVFNINSPADLARAKELLRTRAHPKSEARNPKEAQR